MLKHEEDSTRLIEAIHNRLVREIPNWLLSRIFSQSVWACIMTAYMTLNPNLKEIGDGTPLWKYFEELPSTIEGDLIGLWGLVGTGRRGYLLKDADLREFLVLAIGELLLHGARVIVPSDSLKVRWEETDRYGSTPDEIAFHIVKEWYDIGEPDPEAWNSLAFAKQQWIDSYENQMRA